MHEAPTLNENMIGVSLIEIARANLAKLADREARDKLHGEGDRR